VDVHDNRSWWDVTARPTAHAELIGPHETDVVVVGGGIAGATTAMRLRREGLRVTLVEAERVGLGATAYSTVKVTSAQTLRAHEIAQRHDEDRAVEYVRANAEAVADIATFVRDLGIDCDHEVKRHVVFAEEADQVDALRHEMDLERRAGMTVSWADETDLPFPVAGALVAEQQAQFHPVRYVQGLVEAFVAEGGIVFEDSRVTGVEDGTPCVVTTERGEIRADHVVVATHYPILDRGGHFARLDPQHQYAVAGPIDPGQAPGDTYISTGSPTRSVRTAPDGDGLLLIVVGEKHKVGEGGDTQERYDALASWMAERFDVRDVRYRWSTQDPYTVDGLPMIGRLAPGSERIWVATGFGAWGMTNGTLAARILADAIAGRDNPWASLMDPVRGDVVRGLGTFMKMNLKVAAHWVGDRMSTEAGELTDLEAGEAAILDTDDGKVAAYRDDQGTLHAVSAVCTHMGCLVSWNGTERSWDCPCHGSRFGVDGDVIEPPATEPLDPQPLSFQE
jgi:glycine/D-amino acid oxidase-like deaminating enzyme/nitrite reductase/ring-hydroxylating ferredoxin subunit